MFDKTKFQKLIQKRIDGEDWIIAGDESAWENLANFLSEDINASIEFLENEATPNEIYWASEVFDDIADRTQSKEFLAALHRIHDKMPDDVKKSIEVDIQCAEDCLM